MNVVALDLWEDWPYTRILLLVRNYERIFVWRRFLL